MSRRAALGDVPFAVVDIEATGIYPGGHDRIIEIAVVHMSPRLEIKDEWATLVNPGRDIGRTKIHGIVAGDVTHAPVFDEIVGDVGMRLRDTAIIEPSESAARETDVDEVAMMGRPAVISVSRY